jgi:hypothetical protein
VTPYELRDPDDARQWLLQGLWLARTVPANAETLSAALALALEIASSETPLPPVGFLADVGHIAFGTGPQETTSTIQEVPGLAAGVVREYEDYVLGRLYADLTLERATDALLRYQGRDRTRGLAFLVGQLCQRAGIRGAILGPAAIKRLGEENPDELLVEGWESISTTGLVPHLTELYEQIIAAIRNAGDLLGPEDVFELEHGTALAEFGQRLALRQVLRAAADIQWLLPHQKPTQRAHHHQIATHIRDEDTYPVGGFASISSHGSMESLLHSQLIYMEPSQRPDLFDIKFVRDELLYYSRDENLFLRRRQTFVFALSHDMVHARYKDVALPFQRIIMVLALLYSAVQRLIDWLADDHLVFEFLFLDTDDHWLENEKSLVEMLLREQIANGTVVVQRAGEGQLTERCDQRAQRSLCHCLTVSTGGLVVPTELAGTASLVVDGPVPALLVNLEPRELPAWDTARDGWAMVLQSLLEDWVSAAVR